MILSLSVHLDYGFSQSADVLLQIEAAPLPDQILINPGIGLSPVDEFARIAGEEGIGDRIWLRVANRLICDYTAQVEITRPIPDFPNLNADPLHRLPGEVVRYLLPSRYCPSSEFQNFVQAEFGFQNGGARIVTIMDWIRRNLTYTPGSSSALTTALDTVVQRQGICRDFAHVLITLARASAIPTRMVAVYAPDVVPQDFHAVAEVWLDGRWHLVDATGMAKANEMAVIGVGRDAADVAFMTSYGLATLQAQQVQVMRAAKAPTGASL